MSGSQLTPDELMALQGHIITKGYRAGYVVLSYFISCLGAFTTLEIMMRRTASKGWYNCFLILAASISMGGIATWCMHFVGDCGVILGLGQPQIQIIFSFGLTAISIVIPIVIELIALWVAGSNEASIPRSILGGVLAGLGTCGMHYLGQYGISNYDSVYDVGYLVGAAALAIVASVLSLISFFMLRAHWHASWWKRALCAVVLATGISGMHWLNSVGTTYRLKGWDDGWSDNISKSTVVTVVIVLSIVCCITLIFLTLLEQSRMIRAVKRAEQVVLAAAIFDDRGRICVTHEGFLPRQKIANSWFERSMDDVFGVAHPVFQWIFRASRNWSAISHLIPGMRRHLLRTGVKARRGSLDDNTLFSEEGTPIKDYSIVFRELFCIAAAELAADLHQPIEKLGVLYDEMVVTGLGAKTLDKSHKSVTTIASSMLDLEREGKEGSSLGKGQLLFLVSRVGSFEASNLEAVGFRFTQPEIVNAVIANSLRMGPRSLARRLEIMRTYYSGHHILDQGVHLGCFGIRASLAVGRRGFDILVRRDAKNQLPTVQAPFSRLEPWHLEYLKSMESKSVSMVGKQLYKESKPSNKNVKERQLAKSLLKTLEGLKEEIGDPLFNDALLISRPFDIPCRGKDSNSPPGVASLIAFRIILPLLSRAPGRKLTFTPLNLFKSQQRVVYREFLPLFDITRSNTPDYFNVEHSSVQPTSGRGSTATRNSRNDVVMGEYIDMYGNLLPEPSTQPYRGPSKIRFWDRERSISQSRGENSSEQFLENAKAEDNDRHVTSQHLRAGGDDISRRSPARSLNITLPMSTPTQLKPATGDLDVASREQPPSPAALRTPKGPDEESVIYIDELFALTIAKRMV
ncbi:hypothetical protein BKA64DRAFT_693815 [Cadophora sp. MPI-SDFR-AT-0126]|nr:hypothetical protein BKA64DRAFT_693815 [Leotiomycetes sp. MPI-SDFR-AT-0126]